MAASIDRLDTLGMWDATFGGASQLEAAVAGFLPGLPTVDDLDDVVVLGMGGSGIAGDVLAALAGPASPVPVIVVKDAAVPGFVGAGTLVIALSFSGSTAETVAGAQEALERGAFLVSVTSGGPLASVTAAGGGGVLGVDPAIPMPRAALGALVAPVLAVAEDTGVLVGGRDQLAAAVEQLRRRADVLSRPGNQAEALARTIGRTWPLVYGAGPLGAVAALRWKNQVNENAKAPAFHHTLPEVCHNELCGWGQHGDVTRQVLTLVELRHGFESPDISRRFELMDDQLLEVVAEICVVEAEGDGPLAQLMDLVLVGDVTSLYLAADAGVDPGPIPALDAMKAGLVSDL
jgi:glucose/mannose-6-phosphate isomerase